MGNVIKLNTTMVVRIPDSIMIKEPCEDWALELNSFLSGHFTKDRNIAFLLGKEIKGKFIPFDGGDFDPDKLMEFSHKKLINNECCEYSLYATQEIHSAKEMRKK